MKTHDFHVNCSDSFGRYLVASWGTMAAAKEHASLMNSMYAPRRVFSASTEPARPLTGEMMRGEGL